jgi:heme-degrading monooxygenase HmoA
MSLDIHHAPPYYAVIFTSTQTDFLSGYEEMAHEMESLAKIQPGYLGMVSARNQVGITVSYWATLRDIAHWKSQADHSLAQQKGKSVWYERYSVQICKVERAYSFDKE